MIITANKLTWTDSKGNALLREVRRAPEPR